MVCQRVMSRGGPETETRLPREDKVNLPQRNDKMQNGRHKHMDRGHTSTTQLHKLYPLWELLGFSLHYCKVSSILCKVPGDNACLQLFK